MEEVKHQNSIFVKTMRDMHQILSTLSAQVTYCFTPCIDIKVAEQKTEIYELRKRLTDFHEDTVATSSLVVVHS